MSDDSEDQLVSLTGYEHCIIGTVEQFGRPDIICYDKDLILAKHMADGMTLDDAEDYFLYNDCGGYLGDRTPCFLTREIPEGVVS